MTGAPVLQLRGVVKRFGGVTALRGVDLEARAGSILGLVGQNGAGKSTLMNIVGGVVSPTEGRMLLNGEPFAPRSPAEAARRGIAFIHQELNLFPNLSVAENVFIADAPTKFGRVDWAAVRAQTVQLMQRLGAALSPDQPVSSLSPGERQLVEIAKALRAEARVIIFDEPTTSLTHRESSKLFDLMRRLRDDGAAIVFISHALGDVLAQCDSVAVLRDGAVVDAGPAAAFDQAKLIRAMIGRDLETQFPERPSFSEAGSTPVLEVKGLRAPGVQDLSLSVRAGEVVGLFGLLGAGRTELARAVFGLERRHAGEVLVAGAAIPADPRAAIVAGLAFVTENRREEGLMMQASSADNLALVAMKRHAGAGGWMNDAALAGERARLAAQLSIKGADAPAVKLLSGGNQQKVVVGKWLMASPRALILDEPTRGVDVGAKAELYAAINALVAEGMGVLLISSEIEEVMGMSDRVAVMHRGAISQTFETKPFNAEAILAAAFHEEAAGANAA